MHLIVTWQESVNHPRPHTITEPHTANWNNNRQCQYGVCCEIWMALRSRGFAESTKFWKNIKYRHKHTEPTSVVHSLYTHYDPLGSQGTRCDQILVIIGLAKSKQQLMSTFDQTQRRISSTYLLAEEFWQNTGSFKFDIFKLRDLLWYVPLQSKRKC